MPVRFLFPSWKESFLPTMCVKQWQENKNFGAIKSDAKNKPSRKKLRCLGTYHMTGWTDDVQPVFLQVANIFKKMHPPQDTCWGLKLCSFSSEIPRLMLVVCRAQYHSRWLNTDFIPERYWPLCSHHCIHAETLWATWWGWWQKRQVGWSEVKQVLWKWWQVGGTDCSLWPKSCRSIKIKTQNGAIYNNSAGLGWHISLGLTQTEQNIYFLGLE